MVKFVVELSGGLELLFNKVKHHEVVIENQQSIKLSDVLLHMKDHMIKERPELFLQDNSVRPGILVLINDADWELEGGLEYMVNDGDTLVFISTLHGG